MEVNGIGRGERAGLPVGETTPTVPMLAAPKPIVLQIWRTKAATEVLPLVPVTAAMVGCTAKKFAAIKASARRALDDLDERDAARQAVGPLLGHDRHAAGRRRRSRKVRAVGLGAGNGDEQEARLLAAVGRNAGEFERREARLEAGILQRQVGELHRSSS